MGKKLTDGLRLRPDGVWEKQVRIDGKKKSFSSRDPRQVWKKYSDYMASQAAGQKEAGKLSAVAEDWWEAHQDKIAYGSQGQYSRAKQHISDALGNISVDALTPAQCDAFIRQIGAKYAYTTTANHLTVLKLICRHAVLAGLISASPCQYVTVPAHLRRGTRQPLTDAQRRAIQQATGPDAILAKLILYTGARCGEALALQWRDIQGDAVHIKKAVVFHGNTPIISPTKTKNAVRAVPLLEPLRAQLTPGPPDEYIIGGKKPLTKSQLYSMWARFARAAGLAHKEKGEWRADIDRHQIRHEYATVLFECGIAPEVAQTLMGHADIHTTRQIYTHIRATKIQEAADALNQHFGRVSAE